MVLAQVFWQGPTKISRPLLWMETDMGTKTEQSRLLLVWVICAQCASFLFKHFVYIALCFMSKEDVMAVSKQIHRSYEGPTSVDDADDASSQWSYVSEIDRNSPKKMQSKVRSSYLPKHSYSSNPCQHARTTKRGINHFQKQVRCLDCGFLLLKEWVPPSARKSVQKKSHGSKWTSDLQLSFIEMHSNSIKFDQIHAFWLYFGASVKEKKGL